MQNNFLRRLIEHSLPVQNHSDDIPTGEGDLNFLAQKSLESNMIEGLKGVSFDGEKLGSCTQKELEHEQKKISRRLKEADKRISKIEKRLLNYEGKAAIQAEEMKALEKNYARLEEEVEAVKYFFVFLAHRNGIFAPDMSFKKLLRKLVEINAEPEADMYTLIDKR